jgi:hypothetical protein
MVSLLMSYTLSQRSCYIPASDARPFLCFNVQYSFMRKQIRHDGSPERRTTFGVYPNPPSSGSIVKPACAILLCSLETRITAVFVTGEEYFTVSSYQLSVLVQWKIEGVPVSEDATRTNPTSPKFVMILYLRAFQMSLPSRLRDGDEPDYEPSALTLFHKFQCLH